MHPTIRSASFAAVCFIAASTSAQMDTEHLAPMADEATIERYQCDKLRLYPIMANGAFHAANQDMVRAVPLNKALQDGRLKITEHSDGATVNTLQAMNTSTDTIYLMQGEVVVGGQQDRMLAQDLLVPPGATMDIGAYCVEHGRWQSNGTGQEFRGTIGVVDQSVRKAAAVEGEQTRVWEEVAKDVQRHDAESSSGSYAHLMADKEFQAERERYRARLLGLPSVASGVVGVIAVSGDKVVGCDIFATSELFTQAYPQLVDAYIAEALNSGGPVTMSTPEVQAYFTTLFSDEKKLEEKSSGKGYLFKSKNRIFRMSMF